MSNIIIRPESDTPTRIAGLWASSLLKALGYNTIYIDIRGSSATRATIERSIQKNSHKNGLIIFYCHGSIDGTAILGAEKKVIIDMLNVRLFQNRIVYTVTCHSARILGHEAIKKGAKVYFGYTGEVAVPINGDDLVISLFGKCVNSALLSMIKSGSSAKDAEGEAHRTYAACIDILTEIKDQKHALLLSYNDILFSRLGDEHAKI